MLEQTSPTVDAGPGLSPYSPERILGIIIKLWGHLWSGSSVELYVDNTAVVLPCVNQKPSHPMMSAFLREFLYLVVKFKFLPIVKHIGTKENFVADFLSRNFSVADAAKFFASHGMENMKPRTVRDHMFTFSSSW